MSNRERWIVYPLLFMAIIFGLKHDLAEKPAVLEASTLICEKLCVVDSMDNESRNVKFAISSTQDGKGECYLFGAKGEKAISLSAIHKGYGVIGIFGENGKPFGRLAAGPEGGTLFLDASDSNTSLRLGHHLLRADDNTFPISGLHAYSNDSLLPPDNYDYGLWGIHLLREIAPPADEEEPSEPEANSEDEAPREEPENPSEISPDDLDLPQPEPNEAE